MTAFYMFRAVFLAFFGESRMEAHVAAHAHESPKVMTVPLLILALLSIVGGLVGIPHVLGGGAHFETWLAPAVEAAGEHAAHEYPATLEMGLMGASVGVALLGIFLAYVFYVRRAEWPAKVATAYPRVHRTLWRKYYVDEFNDAAVINPIKRLSTNFLWLFVDAAIIDGAVDGLAAAAKRCGAGFAKLQTGRIYAYALTLVLGAVAILGFVLWRWP
jgi:NADH-quinone oxidoreductase subunit L